MVVEYIILGVIQGVVDWLPISSEGAVVLAQVLLFGADSGLGEMIRVALFLHLGSLLAVIVYFWRDVRELVMLVLRYPKASAQDKAFFHFLVISSAITGVLGFGIYQLIEGVEQEGLVMTGSFITVGIGLMLLITSWMQFQAKRAQEFSDSTFTSEEETTPRKKEALVPADGVVLGLVQAFSVLPGFSRSGSTVSVLLMRKVQETDALKISFFMSLPVILGGNIVLNREALAGDLAAYAGLLAAFVVGMGTIHVLMKVAEKLSFARFTLVFGLLTLAAGILSFLI